MDELGNNVLVNSVDLYLLRLQEEFTKIFRGGVISAYVDYDPVLLTLPDSPAIDLIACDFFCDKPSAGYSLNIIISSFQNYNVLDEPFVTSKQAAKELLEKILVNVNSVVKTL